MFEDLYPIALECEIGPLQFWDMTYGEVLDSITAYKKREKNKLRERAMMDYKLAEMIACNIAPMLVEGAKVPALVEAYEFLFEEEKIIHDEMVAEREMEIWKQKMICFADNHNRKWGDDDDVRGTESNNISTDTGLTDRNEQS